MSNAKENLDYTACADKDSDLTTAKFINQVGASILGSLGYKPEESIVATLFTQQEDESLLQGVTLRCELDKLNSETVDDMAGLFSQHYDIVDDKHLVVFFVITDNDDYHFEQDYSKLLLDNLAEKNNLTNHELNQQFGVLFVLTNAIADGNDFRTISVSQFGLASNLNPTHGKFMHTDSSVAVADMVYKGVDVSQTRTELIDSIFAKNLNLEAENQELNPRSPYELAKLVETTRQLKIDDALAYLEDMAMHINNTPLDELYADKEFIEEAAWYFNYNITRDLVLRFAINRPFEVLTLSKLVASSFADNPQIVLNAGCTHAIALMLTGCANHATVVLNYLTKNYDVDAQGLTKEHGLTNLLQQLIQRNMYNYIGEVIHNAFLSLDSDALTVRIDLLFNENTE